MLQKDPSNPIYYTPKTVPLCQHLLILMKLRGCSFFTLHTQLGEFQPRYETFPGFSFTATKHFPNCNLGVRNIFQFGRKYRCETFPLKFPLMKHYWFYSTQFQISCFAITRFFFLGEHASMRLARGDVIDPFNVSGQTSMRDFYLICH